MQSVISIEPKNFRAGSSSENIQKIEVLTVPRAKNFLKKTLCSCECNGASHNLFFGLNPKSQIREVSFRENSKNLKTDRNIKKFLHMALEIVKFLVF